MTLNQAIARAKVLAKKNREEYWVVFEGHEEGYQVSSEYDLDTHFLGCTPVAYVNALGEEE